MWRYGSIAYVPFTEPLVPGKNPVGRPFPRVRTTWLTGVSLESTPWWCDDGTLESDAAVEVDVRGAADSPRDLNGQVNRTIS